MSPMGKRKKPLSGSRSRRAHGTERAKAGSENLKSAAPGHALVVGIGASAGGLEALKALFGAMPPKSGLVFVVVVHLDPSHDSLMPELLARTTTLSVQQAQDRAPLESDHVYIIPPNRTLTVGQGLLHVQEVADRRGLRGSIDHFFRSLATDQGTNAVGIVLSGTGTEGTLGARAIKSEGGIVIAQSPETASQPGMPASVIAAGLADMLLAPGQMPRALLDYARDTHAHRTAPASAAPGTKPLDELQPILAVLRARTKRDFRGYKRGTLERRIERRMALQQISSMASYVAVLRSHPAEADQLAKDLLIGVTSFFRDPPVFEELASKVLTTLVKEREPDKPLRVWVPGCATGEEAYSIAIALAEEIAAQESACRMQIFATDLDEHALDMARTGTYPETISLDVNPQRLRRFFTHEDHRYTIDKSLRDSVTFAVQNLVSDPAFSRLDLVSCRNVMIYLEPQVQEKLLGVFHFALKQGGYLMLGSAEGISTLEHMFAPVSKRYRIYRRLGAVAHFPVGFPLAHAVPRDTIRRNTKAEPEPTAASLADRELLDHFAPAAVVVKSTGQIVRFYGSMDQYVHLPTGDATLDVLALAHEALKPALHAGLNDAIRHNRRTVLDAIEITRDKSRVTVRVTIRPLGPDGTSQLWLMIFDEAPASLRPAARRGGSRRTSLAQQLEAELRTTKKEQHRLVQQLESSNEELKAANEEILSMNEELQSTNEELVTSKEELQSMNEELTTLNAQLHDKVQELTTVNDDLANLLVSTDIATVFLDADLRVKRFTTAATHLLNLLPTDVGRPIQHMTTNLLEVDLSRDARFVLASGMPVEREATASDGRQYVLRTLPYRSIVAMTIQGVVVTLVDVTALKKTEHDLRATQDQLQHLNQTLEQRVAERTKWLTLLHDVTRAINDAPSWDEALHHVLRRICEGEHWQIGYVYTPDRDVADAIRPAISCVSDSRFQAFHAASEQQRYLRGQALPGRVYADGAPVWLNDQEHLLELLPIRGKLAKEAGLKAAAALPVRFGRDVMAVLELFSDAPHESNDVLGNLMNDVSAQIGEVLERERATAEMADLVWREQQGLLHTLHDSLGQTLTGLGMLSSGLRQQLSQANPPAADTAQKVAEQAQLALEQVRQLARGLFPVEIDPDSLLPALRALASTTETFHKIRVQATGEIPKSIVDSRVATQLYRIAQEAVTNAVKHARARTISIEVSSASGLTRLRVVDDGVGIRTRPSKDDGLGLRIMRYRATSIGALMSIDPGSGGGTVVTCSLRETPLPPEEGRPQ